jgi:YD repeat-containing protein
LASKLRVILARSRWLIVFTSVLSIVSAVPVLAAEPESYPAEAVYPPETSAGEPRLLPDAGDLAIGLEAVAREEAERRRWLESPEAVRQREESRYAFAGIPAADAQALFTTTFTEQLAKLNDDPARWLSEASIVQPLGDTGAIVSKDGHTSLLEAPMPLRAENEAGELSKVDLSLEATDEGFEPANPLSELKIPGGADEPIEIGEAGIAISAIGAEDGVEARLLGEKNVFFPEAQGVGADVDRIVSPTGGGVEIFDLLRSADSPEEMRYEVEMPAGAELRSDGNRGAEVAIGEEVLAWIPFPVALDAQGTQVPVELQVEGDTITLHIDHRKQDLAYPILLDPQILEDWVNQNWFNGYNTYALDIGAWQYTENWSWIHGSTYCIYQCWGSGRGLYVSMPGGAHGANEYGHWSYSAPTPYSYLVNAWVIPFWREDHGCSKSQYSEPHDYVGMWSNQGYWKTFKSNQAINVGSIDLQSAGDALIFGLGTGGGSIAPCWRDLGAGGVAIWLDDSQNPSLDSVSGIPSGWVSDATPITATANARDAGLGVQWVKFFPQGGNAITQNVGCSGLAGSRCPTTVALQKSFTGDSLKEGLRSLQVSAGDPLGKVSGTYETYTRVDRSLPEVILSGQLAQATNEGGNEEVPPGNGDELPLPVYKLKIEAKDGSNAEDKTKRSGVKDIEIFLDGDEMAVPWQQQSCPASSCAMTKTYTLELSGLTSAGKHTLKVRALDQVGKFRDRNIEFEYFPATGMKDEYVMHYFPLPDGLGDEAEEESPARPELAVNVMNGNLVYRERDLDVEGPALDLEVERYYNSMLPDSENTEWGDGWTLGQTPTLEPEAEGQPPSEATMVRTSGAVEGGVGLPAEAGEEHFDPELQATITKEGGGYELADETGETGTSFVFDASGKVTEQRTDGFAKVNYSYEAGKLAEIAVKDPASAGAPTEPVEESEGGEEPSGPYTDVLYAEAFGSSGSGLGQLDAPADVAIDAAGHLWVVDRGRNRIQKFSPDGQYLAHFGSYGSGNGQFNGPSAIALDPAGNLFVVDSGNHRIQKFDAQGQYLTQFGSYGSAKGQLHGPAGIAISANGLIFVADRGNHRIVRFNADGSVFGQTGSFGSQDLQFDEPTVLAIGPPTGPFSATFFVVDSGNNRVKHYTPLGNFLGKFGSYGTGDGQFDSPAAIDVDAKGNIWVGDRRNNRVQLFDLEGNYVDQIGTSGSAEGQLDLGYPMGLATDGADGIWLTDTDNNRLQKWVAGHYVPNEEESEPAPDDPAVQVEVAAGLVSSVEGEEAGQHDYEHQGDLLTAHQGPKGETQYDYDAAGRMTKVELSNDTYASIAYHPDGRVKSVTVAPEGANPKATYFDYSDEPRRSTVTPPDAPHVTYDIGDDGSVLKWWNAQEPPVFDDLAGTLYDNREKPSALWAGDHTLSTSAYSPEGIASIEVIANGTDLVDESTCEQDPNVPGIECVEVLNEWVTATELHAPGHMDLEVLITDRLGQSASERFWVDIPQPPPPLAPGTPVPPTFRDVAAFREEYGLEIVFPVKDEIELNERIFDLIGAWHNPHTPAGEVARSSWERWGVPLRWEDVAELEYRDWLVDQNGPTIQVWAESNSPNTYAGHWMDHRSGGILRLGFTSNQSGTVDVLRQSGQLVAVDRIGEFVSPPSNSISTLVSLQGAIGTDDGSSGGALSGQITRVGIDLTKNKVTVGATSTGSVSAGLSAHYGGGAPIDVYADSSSPQDSRYTYEGPIKGGQMIGKLLGKDSQGNHYRECTAGPTAWERAGTKSNGQPKLAYFLLTAGHCFKEGDSVLRFHDADTLSAKTRKIGEQRSRLWQIYSAPGKFETDGEAIRLDSDATSARIVGAGDSNGVGAVVTGKIVCESLGRRDFVECKPIKGPAELLPFYPGLEDSGPFWQVPVGITTEAGDSGSPVYSPRTGKVVGLHVFGPSSTFTSLLGPPLPEKGPYPYFQPNRIQAPGLLNEPFMGNLHLVRD